MCDRCVELEARINELEKVVFNKKCECSTDTFLKCDICFNLYCNNCVLTQCDDCKIYVCIDCKKDVGQIHGYGIYKTYCSKCYDKNILNKKCKCGKVVNLRAIYTCTCGKPFQEVFEEK